ncbi:MAG: single-stranded-DNA-specific exonuclease RecJ [bacterium]|nr:single-stranded-DNA-specific exonuclease RecJ [bacterium]
MSKKWIIAPPPPAEFFNEHPELPRIASVLLWNRNIRTAQAIDEFLNPDYTTGIHDPFLFNDMEKAVAIIFDAIKNDQNITVHGDYDADGVTASTILVSTIKKLGGKNVGIFIPHRELDGYGLNMNTVKLLHEQKTDVIITCDCGVSNVAEIEHAQSLGIKVIVTDHHSIPAVPPKADALIHPKIADEKYPDKTLCGGAVAFKLAQGLLKRHHDTNPLLPDGQTHESFEKWMIDLVAIASVGDMVPLLGESRTLTRYGLTVLNKTKNKGLAKLLIATGLADANGKPKRGSYDARTVGFQIVPRLNAAGRMDHANSAFALLMAEDDVEAEKLAIQLNNNNIERQKLTEKITNAAIKQIKDTGQETNSCLFVLDDTWPNGILGLVAGRLKDMFYKPTIVMGHANAEIFGSGRSIKEFNMIAAIQSLPGIFHKFGGHPQACGFTLKSPEVLEEFKTAMNKIAAEQTVGVDMVPQIDVDAEINIEEVDWKLYDILQKFEPFGMANEEPTYAARGLTVMQISPLGQDGRHLRLMLKHNSNTVKKTIGFGLGDPIKHPDDWKNSLKVGDKIDMVFSIGVNEWNGNRDLELFIEDIKKS